MDKSIESESSLAAMMVQKPHNIGFFVAGNVELLTLTPDGFYVRGKKIPQDADEAKAVYAAFTGWLASQGTVK